MTVYKVLCTVHTMEDPVSDLSGDDLDFLKCEDIKMAQWSEKPWGCSELQRYD